MAIEHFKNAALPSSPSTPWSTLTASMDASTVTMAVASKAKFPAVPFRFVIGDEYGLATADAGALSYTVTRGIEGSTAASHASAAEVFHVLTAAGLANHPGPMTTEGDTLTLDASGNVVRRPLAFYLTPAQAAAAYQPIGTYLTPSSASTLTNKSGAISQWTNDAGYLTSAPSAAWGDITGTLSAQTDLQAALDAKDLSAYALTANVVPNTRTVNGSALSSNVTISNITGNAGTATALQNARTINGVSFDGTGNITVTAAPTAHNLLSASHGDTLAASVVRGDILYGNSTPAWARLAKPSVLSNLSHDGTDVSWVTSNGTGNPVRTTSPVLVTPTLGDAAATSLSLSAGSSVTGITSGSGSTGYKQFWSNSYFSNAAQFVVTRTDNTAVFHANNLYFGISQTLRMASSGGAGSSDVFVVADAANVLALKNAAAAQELRVYGTTTSSKYLSLKHDGTNPIIGSSSGGLKADSTAITPASTGTRYLIIDTAGNITSSASAPSGT